MKQTFLLLIIGTLLSGSCKKNNDSSIVNVNLTGLQDLGANYVYEGWLIVGGDPVSTGTFTVNGSGQMSARDFSANAKSVYGAEAFVLTIEPKIDPDLSPSGVKILAGDFNGNIANVTISHQAAIGDNFSSATGSYILATPTNGMGTNENSGVWFVNPAAGPGPSLNLPVLPMGWRYEGWAVINGTPLTTGKFTSTSGSDAAAPYSGPQAGPPFPGEDYLMNAPVGLTFPTNLASQKIVITIEPHPDNSTMPFNLKPLAGDVPVAAMDHMLYNMMNTSSMGAPMGTVSR